MAADLWVCEYSPVQRAFHVTTLSVALGWNRFQMERGNFSGYVILDIFKTQEEARKDAERWRKLTDGQ